MNPLARIVAFVAGLAVVFGLGLGIGRAVGPEDVRPVAEHDGEGGHADPSHGGDGDHAGHAAADDLRLDLDPGWQEAGSGERTFRIVDPQGDPVTSYDLEHERRLHLVVVDQASLVDYQHLHPRLGEDGVWSVRATLGPGPYRVYADGSTGGADFVAEQQTGVRGGWLRPPMPRTTTTQRIRGYDVGLDAPRTGPDAGMVTLRVTRDGDPVDDLEPYLGAFGHLVVIRAGSLDYVHAHPADGPAGPEVRFEVGFDRPGAHRLFFEFRHDGRVRTAAFTLDVDGGGEEPAGDDGHEDGGDHGH
jgi:hypothetical protein